MTFKKVTLDFKRAVPIYKQLVEEFTNRIISGELAEGDQMPSIRKLTGDLNINPNTVAKAYREMVADGLLENRRGIGCYVAKFNKKVSNLSADEQKEELDRLFHSVICGADSSGIDRSTVADFLLGRIDEIRK